MKADAKTEAEVMAVMNRYNEAYAKQDVDGIMALFAPDPDMVVIGTGEDEKRIGPAELRTQLERDFAQSEAISIEFIWHSVSRADSVALVAADCVAQAKMTDGQEMSLPLRATFVLEQREGRWLIIHAHASQAAAGQSEGQSFPT
ncbi:nuclear transport factor 2 family protein [Chloroflexota bacterium]